VNIVNINKIYNVRLTFYRLVIFFFSFHFKTTETFFGLSFDRHHKRETQIIYIINKKKLVPFDWLCTKFKKKKEKNLNKNQR
jgi:hypothetical protein